MSNVSVFVGRADDLQAVEDLLMQNSRVNIAAAVGMGGVGKTELAWQYARRRGDAFPGGVCWLRGVEPIAPQIVSFAQVYLNLAVPEQTEDPVAWCVQRWPQEGERNGSVLMVVDDVQDYGALKPLLPSNERFRVLLTTRQAILPVGQRLALAVLVPEAALELLTSLVGAARIEAALADAKALCEWVGRLPLGIELVGWYLARRPDLTIAMLLERLEGKRLDDAKALVDTHPEMTATLGVAAAFEVSWEPLTTEAKTLAGLLGLFAAAPIDWEWVRQAGEQGQVLDEEALEDAQAELLRVNLLQRQETQNGPRYQVHPLVREFFAVKLLELSEAEGLQRGFAQGIMVIARTFPHTVMMTPDMQARVAEAMPHMEKVALQGTAALESDTSPYHVVGLARFYQGLRVWKHSEMWQQHALKTVSDLNEMVALLNSQDRYVAAELLYVRVLKIRKMALGNRHPDTALSLNNLAGLYNSQGRYGEAEPLYLEALDIYKAELGDRHPDTATSLGNLAKLYKSQGRYSEAEPLYVQALEICQTELGNRHPDTATSLNNLAGLYDSQGRYSEAEPLYVQALDIRQTELGDRHPHTATIFLNLAGLYYQTQRHQQALAYIQQALDIYIPTLGSEHPETQAAQSWLVDIQQAINKSI
ncbi:MAG: tetratricopeptide repeat protein [Phormidesmis sp.]